MSFGKVGISNCSLTFGMLALSHEMSSLFRGGFSHEKAEKI